MSGHYGNTVTSGAPGIDPLDDPLVLIWDAIIHGDRRLPTGTDPADAALIRQFQGSEVIPSPTDDFFAKLERQLAAQRPRSAEPAFARLPVSGGTAAKSDGAKRRLPLIIGGNRRFARLAAAVLLILLIAGPLLIYLTNTGPAQPQSIPAAVVTVPTMETLIQLDVVEPLWDMPDPTAWNHMEFSMFQVDPGQTFSTDMPWYTLIDGPLLLVALDGELIIEPVGPARVFRHDAAYVPTDSPAGEPVTLGPQDAIAFSSVAAAAGHNPGSEPVRAVYGLTGAGDPYEPETKTDTRDVTSIDINYLQTFKDLPPGGASVSIRQLRLEPLETFVYEIEPGLMILPVYEPLQINELRIYDGAADGLSPEVLADLRYASRARLMYPDPGPHTLVNIGEETVDLYFMVVEPYSDTATPVS